MSEASKLFFVFAGPKRSGGTEESRSEHEDPRERWVCDFVEEIEPHDQTAGEDRRRYPTEKSAATCSNRG